MTTDDRLAASLGADLHASESHFRALVQHSRDVAGMLDAAGRVVWIAPMVKEMLGFEPDDVTGRSIADFLHPDDVTPAFERLTGVLVTGEPADPITVRVRRPDGAYQAIETAGGLVHGDSGVVEGVIVNLRDVQWRIEAERALLESEARFRTLAEASPVGIFTIGGQGRCLWVNDRWRQITGLPGDEGVDDGWRAMVHPDDHHLLGLDGSGPIDPDIARGATATFRLIHPEGEVRWVRTQVAPVAEPMADGAVAVGTLEDITERVLAERDTERLTDIFEATHDLVGIADRSGRLLYCNRAARRFFDFPAHGDLQGEDLVSRFPPAIIDRLLGEIVPALEREGVWSGELTLERADAALIPVSAQLLIHTDADGSFEFFSGVLRDISERKAFEQQLAHQATHDPLTGLPNRVHLLDTLRHALARARVRRRAVGVLFLDLDHFKVVNDSLGHGLGDKLLVAIAERLHTAIRPGDTIARFGGDEFVLLCEDLDDERAAVRIARRVTESISGSFPIGDAEVYVGTSIGIALSTPETTDPETLIRDADAAMYRAKDKGRARWEVFDGAMRASAVDRLDIENALRRALDRRELRVYYQPIVDLRDRRIAGVEALLRWEHPERGLLLPGEFITVAEETGLIVPIGRWVLEQACRQVQRWRARSPDDQGPVVTVNLSGRQLGHPNLVSDVAATLRDTGIDPSVVHLEITESVLMDDVEMSDLTLSQLCDLGVKLVVDDFGTGYSSLSYLRQFPVDVLKIDQSFVSGLGRDHGDSAIAAAIVNLAHTLGLEAIAEGVEHEAQLAELVAMDCDQAQGFHLARPADGDTIGDLLATGIDR